MTEEILALQEQIETMSTLINELVDQVTIIQERVKELEDSM